MPVDFDKRFLLFEQPFTCPYCGVRTIIVFETLYQPFHIQIHSCFRCSKQFVVDCDEEDDF